MHTSVRSTINKKSTRERLLALWLVFLNLYIYPLNLRSFYGRVRHVPEDFSTRILKGERNAKPAKWQPRQKGELCRVKQAIVSPRFCPLSCPHKIKSCGDEPVMSSLGILYDDPYHTFEAAQAGSALWMLHGWCHVKCCRFSASSVYTIQPCTRLQCHFIQSHIGRVYVCLAVTCHLHFWQNDRDLLCATAVTWGWNGYRNKSLHRKLTLKKNILPPLLLGLEPGTFWSRVWRSNHWDIPAPQECKTLC